MFGQEHQIDKGEDIRGWQQVNRAVEYDGISRGQGQT